MIICRIINLLLIRSQTKPFYTQTSTFLGDYFPKKFFSWIIRTYCHLQQHSLRAESAQLFAYWVILHAFCRLLIFFSESICSKNYLRNTIGVSKSLNPDQARRHVGPDQGPNCLQWLLAADTSQQRVHSLSDEFLKSESFN